MLEPDVTPTWQGPRLSADTVIDRVPGLSHTYLAGITSPLLGARMDPAAGFTHSYRVNEARVNREQLVDFQQMFQLPSSPELPLGFVHIVGFPVAASLMARRDFPLPLAGMVHTKNLVESYRPILLTDTFTLRAFASTFRPHRRGTEVDLVVEVGQDDTVWWRGTSTYLVRGVRMEDDGSSPSSLVKDRGASGKEKNFTPPTPTARWQLDAALGRRYGRVSGDRNPIHLSALSARAFGFRRAIIHGMYTASRALAASTPLPPAPLTWSTKFFRPVLLPGSVDLAVTRGSDGGVSYTAWKTGSSELHLTGEVKPA